MKRTLLLPLLLLVIAIVMVAIALYVPNSLPAHSDFSALYNTDLALVNGIPIYDIPSVEALAQERSGIPAESFFLARFPYPPWYALSTFYLGFLPAQSAALLWFELNLAMLFLSVWLLTDGWTGRARLLAFPLPLFFLPVVGALAVGQYDFPVLLGVSLLIYALRKENVALSTLGMVLLTFKPHVGALVLVSALAWLLYKRDAFARRALRSTGIAGVLLFGAGFLADPAWIISYPRMLLDYQKEGNVSACSECASLPVWLSRWLFDGSLAVAALIGLASFALFLVIVFLARRAFLGSPVGLFTFALAATLLVSPYLYNYDYLLLLVPFAVLGGSGGLLRKSIVFLCYLVPTVALLMFGRAGNISLVLVTILITVLLYILNTNKPVIDVPVTAA